MSDEIGLRKPDPKFIDQVYQAWPETKPWEICLIGDMIDRDIKCAHLANIRSLWYRFEVFDQGQNYRSL